MRVLIQRVNSASVVVDNRSVGAIDRGLMLLVGFGKGDSDGVLQPMAQKVCNMRLFPQERSHFHTSVLEEKGGVLLVPQFTLYADIGKGRRPDFFGSLEPGPAKELFEQFVSVVKACGVERVERGVFGAHMKVSLENDGPVTVWVEL